MKNIFRRVTAILGAAIGLVCQLPPLHAAAASVRSAGEPTILVQSEQNTVQPGGLVSLDVFLADNPGTGILTLSLAYDSEIFTLDRVENGVLFQTSMMEISSGKKIDWDTGGSDVEKDGLLAELIFSVSTSVNPCTSTIGVSCEPGFSASYNRTELVTWQNPPPYTVTIQRSSSVPSEPTPVPSEPTPVPSEPTPVPSEPTPVPSEPTPVPSEPTPVPSAPTPVPPAPTYRFLYENTSDGIRITGFTGTLPKDLTIPATLDGKKVVEIGEGAFRSQNLTSLVLSRGILRIGEYAFYLDHSLCDVTLPDTITEIGGYSFAECGLSRISIRNAYDDFVNIGPCAFAMNRLTDVEISWRVFKIGNAAFANNCIQSITIPGCVQSIGRNAFLNNQIRELVLGHGVNSIDVQAFAGNPIQALSLPETLYGIGKRAFADAEITRIQIPRNVNRIGEQAFGKRLRNVTLDEENKHFVLQNGALLTESLDRLLLYTGTLGGTYTVPGSVKTVDAGAFRGTNLTEIILPPTLRTINADTFSGSTALRSVLIPKNVRKIAENAFSGCSGLSAVKYGGSQTDRSGIDISDGNKNLTDASWQYGKDVTYTITFSENGGKLNGSKNKTVMYGRTYGTMPTATRTGYTFAGWYTGRIRGTKITADTTVKVVRNTVFYAHWTPKTYTVTFHANGGQVSPSRKTVTFRKRHGTLPTPRRSGYRFLGWYTKQSGGVKINDYTIVVLAKNRTLYAHWTR